MPYQATVTSTDFFTFLQKTKAKASEVNTNFNLFRGHILPIDPTSVAAANNAYDLGASDHQWRRIYLEEAPLVNGNQLGGIRIDTVTDGSVLTDIVDPTAGMERIAFPDGRDAEIKFQFSVPHEYVAGKQIQLTLKGYPETTGSSVFYSDSYLFQAGDAGDTVSANILTGTATLGNSVSGAMFSNTDLKLTDASGLINSVTVGVGDIISVNLRRKASVTADTNAGYIFLTDIMVDLNT